MASVNTEKPMGKAQKAKVTTVKTTKKTENSAPVKTEAKKAEVKKVEDIKTVTEESPKTEVKKVVKVIQRSKRSLSISGRVTVPSLSR